MFFVWGGKSFYRCYMGICTDTVDPPGMCVDPKDTDYTYPAITTVGRHVALVFLVGVDWDWDFRLGFLGAGVLSLTC